MKITKSIFLIETFHCTVHGKYILHSLLTYNNELFHRQKLDCHNYIGLPTYKPCLFCSLQAQNKLNMEKYSQLTQL